MKYDQIGKLDKEKFRRLTGVKKQTFDRMIEILKVSDKEKKSSPSLSKRSKSEVKHKVMHHYILKAAALKEKGRPSRLKTE